MRFRRWWMALGSAVVVGAGCSAGQPSMPEPRPLVLRSGARLVIEDPERFRGLYDTLTLQLQNIIEDPSFFVSANPDPRDLYPWESLEIAPPDTVRVLYTRTAPDVRDIYEIYAHLHIMEYMGRLDEWLPAAVGLQGWELERAIVGRVVDFWLMGRALFDLAPYDLLDRLIYAQEAGQLDALLLTLRAHEFPEARADWLAENPDGPEAFRDWYRATIGEEPPEPTGGG